MNARFSVVAIASLVFGIFMLVGFMPLGIALMVLAWIIQSGHRKRTLALRHARRAHVNERARQQRDIAVRSLR